tara:strand:+ start:2536 stop:2955 length:420 start_codon:yes stop_codon:yes gene_type:complete
MGTFIGDVETRWLVEKPDEKLSFFKRSTSWLFDWDTDRKMLLLSNFTYIDNTGKEWTARKGEIVDGASIPKAFWRFVGPPLTGDYRRSSVIHDVLCQYQLHPYKEVHSLFCQMMKDDDVSYTKRKMMCKAVKWFGPKWG